MASTGRWYMFCFSELFGLTRGHDIRAPFKFLKAAQSFMSDARSGKSSAKIVIVDDDPLLQKLLERFLSDHGLQPLVVSTGRAGMEAIQRERPSLVILDHVLPDVSGLEILNQIQTQDPHLPVIYITARGGSSVAIEAMKRGAFDYLTKPLDLARVEQKVERALEIRRLMRVPVVMTTVGADDAEADQFIGVSAAIQEVFKVIGRVAMQDVPALVEGEAGTGRELVARAIYRHGSRRQGPFYIVSCGDQDAMSLEVELFGSDAADASSGWGGVKGSAEKRVGRFDQAKMGVLLIHEIDRLPSALQRRLFQKLNEAEADRLHGRPSSAPQVIGTTTQSLEPLVREGKFRTDLFYLLNSFRIKLPPLRERPEDIPLLVGYFVRRYTRSRALGDSATRVSAEAMQLLEAHPWPGNIDELQSILRRALVETRGTIVPSEFLQAALGNRQIETRSGAQPGATDWSRFLENRIVAGSQQIYEEAVAEMEQHLLSLVLEATDGNQAHAARLLGITRGNLRKKIRAHGLSIGRKDTDEEEITVDNELV